MTEEKIQEYTARISKANKTGMVVVIYDITLTHIEDAIDAIAAGDNVEFKKSITMAQKGVSELINGLNMDYELSEHLMSLYVYANKQLLFARLNKAEKYLAETKNILTQLKESFEEIAKKDESAPLIQKNEHVVVGMTYGRSSLNENVVNSETTHTFSV